MLTRKALADAIDAYDDEITALQDSKRETYAEYRAELADRMGKDEIKDEIEATKAAIKRRRAIREKGEETVDHRDALVDEIFAEITAARAPRATRVEIINEFGEFPETAFPASAGAAADVGGGENAPALHVDTNQPETAEQVPTTTNGGSDEAVQEPVSVNLDRRQFQRAAGSAADATEGEHQRSHNIETNTAPAGGVADETPASNLLHMPAPKPQFVQVPFEGAINT